MQDLEEPGADPENVEEEKPWLETLPERGGRRRKVAGSFSHQVMQKQVTRLPTCGTRLR